MIEVLDAVANVLVALLVKALQCFQRDFFLVNPRKALFAEKTTVVRDVLDAKQMAEGFAEEMNYDHIAIRQLVFEKAMAERRTVEVL